MSPSRFFISALSSSVLSDGCNEEGDSMDLGEFERKGKALAPFNYPNRMTEAITVVLANCR